ncbi:malto-oligosyltrehalose synthase [Pedococcus sp. 5OH_020]|uniref:malto-oligosyltrehalose synthase n=1 Tax=Pedococcus sp. 5OH_020 TaxID=2989814 RepID=UPI0022E9A8E5|nr:malto-oligosyltrehalose synthase [Pedococcus sp. 5OH_020]
MSQARTEEAPAQGPVVPTGTYRLQIQPAFTFDEAAEQARYLVDLGVSHAYLSPVLQPAPGSTHGYDVVDHERFNEEAGGSAGFERLSRTLSSHGLRLVVDVVPNHMTTPTPAWLNRQWWDLLRRGRESEFAHWFDVDWDAEDGHVLMPVLGGPLDAAIAAGELEVSRGGRPAGDEAVLRYFDHELPLRPGTEGLDLPDLVAAQHYRLCDWREGATRLNYRRFFDVTSLVAVKVEDKSVFEATHRLLLEAFRANLLDGFRIDHPDGLADPAGYLADLADATDGAWVVVEKILEGHEELPRYWRCAGTTGYDTLQRVGGVFVDPRGEEPLTELLARLVGRREDVTDLALEAKQQVVESVQAAEVNRLMRLVARVLPGHDQGSLRRAVGALLVAMDRYRAYLGPGGPEDEREEREQEQVLADAQARALRLVPEADHLSVHLVTELARGGRLPEASADSGDARLEFVVRFQQTCGPVMAKGIEDTTFYRYARLISLNEVGGDPAEVGTAPDELHHFAARQLAAWPATMTTLSTHDTKRSEDVRARLAVLSELPEQWSSWLAQGRDLTAPHRGAGLDASTEYLLWQTAVGAWPLDEERLQAYATKAVREAKRHTSWTDPDESYEGQVATFVRALTTDPAVRAHLQAWAERTQRAWRANVLGQKLLQLLMPGVPDVYQGTELVDLSLVDPDNRRAVDYDARRRRLARLDDGNLPADLDDEKLLVTSRALRLRREHPQWFTGAGAIYSAVATSDEHALAFARGDEDGPQVVAVLTRLSEDLAVQGGWLEGFVELPPGHWQDLLTGRAVVAAQGRPGNVRLSDLLADLPVALLLRGDGSPRDEETGGDDNT